MSRPNRHGFTLVELLVVVVIISMLMALLVPSIAAARRRVRQTECLNNLKELGEGVLQYANDVGHFPGYANPSISEKYETKKNKTYVLHYSWVVAIFPYTGHEDVWQGWRRVEVWDDILKIMRFPRPTIGVTICPEDPQKTAKSKGDAAGDGAAGLSYVANVRYFGDRLLANPPETIGLSDVAAPANTIMLSERTTPIDNPTPTPPTGFGPPDGIITTPALNPPGTDFNPPQTWAPWQPVEKGSVPSPQDMLNLKWSVCFNVTWRNPDNTLYDPDPTISALLDAWVTPETLVTSFLSSTHNGGVNAIFFDGHGELINLDRKSRELAGQ